MGRSLAFLCALCVLGGESFVRSESLFANPPTASYIFPAGGQRGTTVPVRVGGLFLYNQCEFDLSGRGITASPMLPNILYPTAFTCSGATIRPCAIPIPADWTALCSLASSSALGNLRACAEVGLSRKMGG